MDCSIVYLDVYFFTIMENSVACIFLHILIIFLGWMLGSRVIKSKVTLILKGFERYVAKLLSRSVSIYTPITVNEVIFSS